MKMRRPLIWLGWSVMILYRLSVLPHRYFDTDELEHFHAAWCTARGLLLYKDFFEHHGPLLSLLLAPLTAMIRDPVLALTLGRLLMLLCWALVITVTCQWFESNRKPERLWLLILFLFSFSTFSIKALEIRPDVPATLCLVICLWLLSRSTQMKRAFLFGLCAAFGILFTPKVLYPLAGALMGTAWAWRKTSLRTLAAINGAMIVGFIIPWSVIVGYFWLKGGLVSLYQCFWVFNTHFRGTFSAIPLLRQSFIQNPLIWLFAGWGLVGLSEEWTSKGAFLGWLVGLWCLPVAYPQDYLLVAPVLCYLGVAISERFIAKRWGFLVLAGLVPGFLAQVRDFRQGNQSQVEEIHCVMENTSPHDKVFDAWTGIPVYRPHAWYFWFLHDEVRVMLRPEFLESQCLKALNDPSCRALIWGHYFDTLPESVKIFARNHFAPAGCGRLYIRK